MLTALFDAAAMPAVSAPTASVATLLFALMAPLLLTLAATSPAASNINQAVKAHSPEYPGKPHTSNRTCLAQPTMAIEETQHQHANAVLIQAAVRGHLYRLVLREHVYAHIRIAATARGWIARSATRKLRVAKMVAAWPAAVTKIAAFWHGIKARRWSRGEPRRIAVVHLRRNYEAAAAEAEERKAQRSSKKRSGNRKPKVQPDVANYPTIACPDHPWARTTYLVAYLKPMADFGVRSVGCNRPLQLTWRRSKWRGAAKLPHPVKAATRRL